MKSPEMNGAPRDAHKGSRCGKPSHESRPCAALVVKRLGGAGGVGHAAAVHLAPKDVPVATHVLRTLRRSASLSRSAAVRSADLLPSKQRAQRVRRTMDARTASARASAAKTIRYGATWRLGRVRCTQQPARGMTRTEGSDHAVASLHMCVCVCVCVCVSVSVCVCVCVHQCVRVVLPMCRAYSCACMIDEAAVHLTIVNVDARAQTL